ncbi:AMP-binding protein [Sphingosinicella sp. CPCC 101087]|uniref:AMP-binding protein n=1 Tax=Sphingosinicella sp. CPCC 101087 TaxID=2497754 RepID=UPI00101C358E|nr:AMP-binding protein [Sphingosinicella sp. CPCC 101087]
MRAIDYFDRGAAVDPTRIAMQDSARAFTFAEAQALTKRIAVAMEDAGFPGQAPVALYSANNVDVLLALLGLWRANAKWIPLNTRNAIDANAAYLAYVRCEWLFYHSSLAGDVAELKRRVPTLRHFVCLDKAHDGDPSMEAFIGGVDGGRWKDPSDPFGNPDEIVGIFPTGGTTGPSKGVEVTNLGWGTMIETVGNAIGGRTDRPVNLVVAPLTHAAGPVALATMQFGATQIILPGFDPQAVFEAIERHRVTHLYLPPTALYALLGHDRRERFDLSSLKIFVLVGSAVSPDKLRQAVEAFGPCMCQAYGQVESPMITCWLPPETVAKAAAGDRPELLASCGKPSYSVRVAVMDDEGNILPPGEAGEICVRGALVSKGYFELPEATAEFRTFGWHHTGDVGRFSADGYLFIVDRKKDMVVTGGFNVYSAEVEAAIMELDAVRECAVIGVPHEHWGEAVHAVVVADGIDEPAIIAHAKARLGGVKAPKSVSFADSIPRTAAGKMDKKALRREYWGNQQRMVH